MTKPTFWFWSVIATFMCVIRHESSPESFNRSVLNLALRIGRIQIRPMQRVIVTGGATNIGRAITEAFLAQGANVVVGQLDAASAAPLIAQHGDQVSVLEFDAGDAMQCRQFVDQAAEKLGGLDVLVNNAAITGVKALTTLAELSSDDFDRMTKVNLGGPIFCAQAAVPHFREAGGGVIVNISSVNAFKPQAGGMVYAASKAALGSVTQSMARELAADGIRVVAVAPGDIQVDTSAASAKIMCERGLDSEIAEQTPLGQGEPNDVAETVVFLGSGKAKFVTGTTWIVDGGLLA
jgi:NAD(P)-dependent dehydrogenase (short-subunit alcohol dehydrogenase family)